LDSLNINNFYFSAYANINNLNGQSIKVESVKYFELESSHWITKNRRRRLVKKVFFPNSCVEFGSIIEGIYFRGKSSLGFLAAPPEPAGSWGLE